LEHALALAALGAIVRRTAGESMHEQHRASSTGPEILPTRCHKSRPFARTGEKDRAERDGGDDQKDACIIVWPAGRHEVPTRTHATTCAMVAADIAAPTPHRDSV